MDTKKTIALIAVLIAAIAGFHYTLDSLSYSERAALVVLIVAAGFWTTEAIPLTATSMLIPLLQYFLGVQGFKEALSTFFDPVVMLMLGGFLLAIAVEKNDLDEYFAYQIVSRVKASSRFVILAIMLTTSFLSMWISNTASTALMMTIALKLTKDVVDKRNNFGKIVVLSIAYSATAGGLSPIVGTPTCAMAVGFLKDILGYEITFLGWMIYGVPITLVMIIIVWILLFAIFPTDVEELPPFNMEVKSLERKQKLTLVIFIFSILLWLTGKLPEPLAMTLGWPGHGMSSSVVAAVIAVFLLFTGLIQESDLSRANWGILLLFGGGLSLGAAMEVSGLVIKISEFLLLFTGGASRLVTIALMTAFGLGISIIASNTASAGIFLPIAIGLGVTTRTSPVILAIAVGVATSLDFMLPVGTPPNAIAYSTGKVSMKAMIKAGVILDLTGALVTIALAEFLWPLFI